MSSTTIDQRVLFVTLVGFPNDSAPDDGIPLRLTGNDGAGHIWNPRLTARLNLVGTDYILQANRELSNGTWTMTCRTLYRGIYS